MNVLNAHRFPSLFDELFAPELIAAASAAPEQFAAYEIEENEEHFLLTLEMPGIPKEGLRIELADNWLTVEGERSRRGKLEPRKFQRRFKLPDGVDGNRIEADYQDGILLVAVPKPEAAKPRQIVISSNPNFFEKLLGQNTKGREAVPSRKNEVA